MHFQPAKAKSQSKQVEYVFSLRKPLSTGKPGKSDKSGFTNSVFSGHSSKAKKSIFFLRKSARNCPPAKVVRSRKSVKTEKSFHVEKRTVPQRFFNTNLSLFSFSTMPANDRGYGHGRFAGEFPVVKRQGKCGRKTR
jgi:hypothetical protein